VIFDSPPPTIFPDAAILAARVDAVLVVADATITQRALLADVANQLRQSGAKLLGLVLNRSKDGGASSRQAYYRYYYDSEGHREHRRTGVRGTTVAETAPISLTDKLQEWRERGPSWVRVRPTPEPAPPPREEPEDEAHPAEQSAG